MADNGLRPVPDMTAHLSLTDEYREMMRKHTTISILLGQLTSPSMTVVSNTCFILSNLSAESHKYQKIMWDLGAVPKLRTLTQSRHEMIAMAASSTLKNLLLSPVKPSHMELRSPESPSCSIPSLHARKLKALKDDIKSTLSDSYDPIESPVDSYARRSSSMGRTNNYLPGRMYTSFSGGHVDPHQVSRSNSHDSIGSTHSEPVAKLRQTNQNLYLFGSPTVPQIYSNIYANEDRVAAELEMTEEFEPYCREQNAQMTRSSSSMKNSSFVEVLDEDPEPTDYSQRYQERPIDDFPLTDKPEVVGNEDSVKLYMTEGTPLNYSLVSSLTDLREAALSSIDEEKKAILANIENESQPMATKSEPTNEKKVPKVSFKKPIPPPKPNLRNFLKKDLNKSLPPTQEEPVKVEAQEEDISKLNIDSNDLCKETPLMYSRSSSLGSLSDCEIKSDVCQSSVVSEFSRRQSEVVTPSELPDSPLDSPRPVSPKPISNSAKSDNDNKVEIEKPDLMQQSSRSDEMCHQNIKSDNYLKDNVFEDRPITFATEDTPAVFSLSTSLSSLDEKSDSDEKEVKLSEQNISVNVSNDSNDNVMKCNNSLEVNDINTQLVSTSSEDESDDELLAACISSAMKKSNEKLISYNSLTRTESKKSAINSMPSKPISMAVPRKSSVDSSGPPMARSAPDGQSSSREKDSLKVLISEKTDINSCSDLSISSKANVNTLNISSYQSQCHSDESDDEEILKKCIASGMSAYRNKKSVKSKSSPKTPKTTPNPSPSAVVNNSDTKDINPDQTQRFFVEDTPIELTHCHSSLSSLSMKSDEHTEDQKLLNEIITRGMNNQTKNSKIPKAMPRTSKMKNNLKIKITNLDDVDDPNTYTICHKNQRSSESLHKKSIEHPMVSSVMTASSNLSDLDNIKPPSLMDNTMFSSTESFSYRQVAVKPSDEVLIDNVKPPSLMEEISMSQSCASITSEISDIALDSDVNNERIAQMASDCVQRLNLMTYSADNSECDTLDRIFGSKDKTIKHKHLWSKHIEVELSDTEVSEDLPIDSQEANKTLSHNDITFELETTSHNLPLESPTICADIYSDFDEENRIIRRERELLLNGPRISPIGSEEHLIDELSSVVSDESELDSRATYNVNSPRRARIVRPVIRKNKHHNQDMTNILTNQLSLNRPPMASARNRYTAKQTRTSALRADRSRSVDAHYDEDLPQVMSRDQRYRHSSSNRGKQKQYNIDIPVESFSKSAHIVHHQDMHHSYKLEETDDSSVKNRDNKDRSLLSNFRSKLSSSLSSNNLRSSNASLSSNSSTGVTPSCASFSRKLEVQSRIASLWKRSKSSSSEKSHKKSSTDSDLSRSISARRSFGKSKNDHEQSSESPIQRSSTYEKLPQSDKEANTMDVNPDSDRYNNNFVDTNKRHSNQRSVDKNNGNAMYHTKHQKLDVMAKNRINLANNNNSNKQSQTSHHSTGLSKSSSKSRRTCLVTAV